METCAAPLAVGKAAPPPNIARAEACMLSCFSLARRFSNSLCAIARFTRATPTRDAMQGQVVCAPVPMTHEYLETKCHDAIFLSQNTDTHHDSRPLWSRPLTGSVARTPSRLFVVVQHVFRLGFCSQMPSMPVPPCSPAVPG